MASDTPSDVQTDYDEYRKAGRVIGRFKRDRIKQIKVPRTSKEIRDRFLAIGDLTSVVSDVMDQLGVSGVIAASHMKPIVPWSRVVGTAVTLRNVPERKQTHRGYVDKDPARMVAYEFFLFCEQGDVCVFDFGGNLETSNFGGNAGLVAKACGIAGAIAFGAIRDAETMRDIDFPIWSSGVTPKTGKYRLESMEMNGPVTVHDVIVYPGDLVIADENGIAFIPPEHIEAVLKGAEEEEKSASALRKKLEVPNISIKDVGAALGIKPQ